LSVLCDLDGVIYRGGRVLPGVPDALRRLDSADIEVLYITNNSTRSPRAGAEKISSLTGIPVNPEQVLTSSRAAAAMLRPDDGPVFVVGEEGVREAVNCARLEMTTDPTQAQSVLVGLTRELSYQLLHDAMVAVRGGARFVATNTDTTFPTEEGLAPGSGAIVAAIVAASGREPEVAGKPHPPMVDLILSRVDGPVWVIGDRLDTDIALAKGQPDWTSILVLTGVTAAEDALVGDADHIVSDFPAAVDLVLSASEPS
jgi:HAD superfamily hydrolase (TIGR01450 family)